jgi:hypothetical protein
MSFQSAFTRNRLLPAASASEWLRNLGIVTTGTVYFVDSTTGNNGYTGLSPADPVATLAYAITLATASVGDVIVLFPGHAEAISAAGTITVSKAGLTIVGGASPHAHNNNKPTFTFGTATTATFKITANNVTVQGCRFVCNIDSMEKFIDDAAERTTFLDCDFVTSSTKEALCFIEKTTTKDFFTAKRCTFVQPTDPTGTDGNASTGGFYGEDVEHVLFEDCMFAGNFETAFFHNKTTAGKYWWVRNCWGRQDLSGAEPFLLAAGCTGAMLGGGFITPAEVAVTEATLVGTLGDGFFILQPGSFGNDGGAGGQGGVVIATAS